MTAFENQEFDDQLLELHHQDSDLPPRPDVWPSSDIDIQRGASFGTCSLASAHQKLQHQLSISCLLLSFGLSPLTGNVSPQNSPSVQEEQQWLKCLDFEQLSQSTELMCSSCLVV